MKKTAITLSLLLATSCSVSSNQGVMKAQERSGGFMGLSTNEQYEVNTKEAFKGVKDVVIASFKVGFNESKKESKKAGGGLLGGGFGGKSSGLVKLVGIDGDIRQQITDKAYEDFTAKLKAAGYNIVDREKFTSSEEYKGMKKYPMPYHNDTSSFLSEYGQSYYYSPSSWGKEEPIFPGEVPEVTGGFAFDNPISGATIYADKNKVKVLNVSYAIDFAGSSGHGSTFSMSSSVEVGQLLSVDQGVVGLFGGQGGTFSTNNGSIKLGQPIASEKTYGEVINTTSDAEVAGETALNVASALLGAGTNQTREFEFKADPEKYKAISIEVLEKANKGITDKMAALR